MADSAQRDGGRVHTLPKGRHCILRRSARGAIRKRPAAICGLTKSTAARRSLRRRAHRKERADFRKGAGRGLRLAEGAEGGSPPEALTANAFPLRGRWHPPSPARRMPDEVAFRSRASASMRSTPRGRIAFPLRGRWPEGPDEVASRSCASASMRSTPRRRAAFPLRAPEACLGRRWPEGPDEVAYR